VPQIDAVVIYLHHHLGFRYLRFFFQPDKCDGLPFSPYVAAAAYLGTGSNPDG
jgi:hypothetical protein